MCIGVLPHVCLCDSVRYPGIGVTDSCELLYGSWKLNPGFLEEQPMLLTSETSLEHLEVLTHSQTSHTSDQREGYTPNPF